MKLNKLYQRAANQKVNTFQVETQGNLYRTITGFEDGIKTKSPDNYENVEKSMDEISGELKAAKPQKDKLITALQSLEKTINTISKS